MKKIYSILLCIGLVASFVACEKDKDFALTTLSVANETITPWYESAQVSCSFKADATISEACVQYALSSSFVEYKTAEMAEEKGVYSAQLTDLQSDTMYYVRYVVSNKYSQVVSEAVVDFRTLQPVVPIVVLDTVSEVWDHRAIAQMRLVFYGGAAVTDMGICWGTQPQPTMKDIHRSTDDTLALIDITSLQPNTKYYARAYAVNKAGVAYSEEKEFVTLTQPEVRTDEVRDIELTSAVLVGKLLFNGNDTATIKGFCWGEKAVPTVDDDQVAIDTLTDEYSYLLSNLKDETQYFVRAYAKNKIGVVYGEERVFTTQAAVAPKVVTKEVKDVDDQSATVQGEVTSDGGAEVTERGVVYGTSENPTVENSKVVGGSGTGMFTCNLTGLQPNTKYYVRAYAVNKKGTAYGEQVSFTTLEEVSATPEYVDLGLSVKWADRNVGASKPEEYGDYFAWGETESKSIYDWSTYKWCRGSYDTQTKYCTNSSYGTVDNETTLEAADDAARANWGGSWRMPTDAELTELRENCTWTWTTQNGVNGYKVTSKSNGNSIFLPAAGRRYSGSLDPAGSSGYYWSSSLNTDYPNGAWYVKFSSDGVYRYDLSRYYGFSVRPVYGEYVPESTLPVVTTGVVTQITETTAVAGGNVTADGGASVTERGVVYSTTANPTTTNTKKVSGSGTGAFTCYLTGLQASTTYYVRAYAINEKGTSYGDQVSFTTLEEASATPEYVDLGLSVKWATFNVGATKPEDYGDYFAWGETAPKEVYDWSTYKWCNGSKTTLTKYCTDGSYGTVDNKTQLELSDDAARAHWGGDWRMPTDAELTELRENCTWTWTTQNGVNGYKVTSNKSGYTNKSIFLPAAGHCYGSSLGSAGSDGLYWSSSLNSGSPYLAWNVGFGSGSVYRGSSGRYSGQSVRPVYGEYVPESTLPVVTTSVVTQITETTAVAGGNVTSDGGASVTERGVVYGTSENPTVENSKVVGGSGTGMFTCNLTGLQPNTKYYVRAYAVNKKGTVYGEQVSFTTLTPIVVPTVMTHVITQIAETTAVAGGNVTADGGASVTERGVVYSTSENPTTANSKVVGGSGTGMFTCNLTGLQPNTKYYVRAYAVNSKGTAYGEQVSFTTLEEVKTTAEYVDLGLSVKWATVNVGATKPEEYGDYFAWGETEPKSTYNWSTYKWCNGSETTLTKYCTDGSYGTVDNKTQLELSDDASHVNWGSDWRIPTDAELNELVNECTWTWIAQNGVKGYKVIGSNGNSIFLPAAGFRSNSDELTSSETGNSGVYASRTLVSFGPSYSLYLFFDNENKGWSTMYRYVGYTIRPVYGAMPENSLASVTSSAVTQITETTAVAGGKVTADGGSIVLECGVVYGTSQNPTTDDKKVTSDDGSGDYTCNLTDLQASTTYYVRAYAVNSKGTAYGEQVSFTTLEEVSATPEYVDLGLSVKWADRNVGASKPEEYGDYFAWGETQPKEVYDWSTYKWCNGSETTLTKYCTNDSLGTVDNKRRLELSDDAAHAYWGGDWRMPTREEFWELEEGCTWTWTTQNGVNGYKVISKSNGNSIFLPAAGYRYVSSLSGAGSYGRYWLSSGDGSDGANYFTFMSSRVDYYGGIERYNGQSVRPVYGEYVPEINLPVITTSTITQITETTAVAGGNVTADGGASVTERGVVYSTTANPTTANTKKVLGSGTGAFTCNLTGLQASTTYYVRAYAINEKGTAYGEQVTFKTLTPIVPPTITTSAVTQITETTAVAGGNVTADGGASVTERGVVYSTSENPTTANSKVVGGNGTGAFTCNLTGLQASTTYYVRAYAINEKGTAYGEQVSFTTLEEVSATPEYVDLGLSVKWATVNVGATKAEEYGDYFAWGETEPKSTYNWSTYKWCNGSETTLTKYCTDGSYGTIDNKTQLELSDDAAHVNWGGSWRMPTDTEFTELRENCTWTWTTQNGVKGCKVTSKSNGNSIFLPAAGCRLDSSLGDAGSYGNYWSGSLSTGYPEVGLYVSFGLSNVVVRGGYFRCSGFSVRPVYGEYIPASTMPTVTTSAVTQITETTAVAGGNVTSDGGASVTERGVVYSTSENPTTASSKVVGGSGTGAFTCNLADLQAGTTYYVRAYAVNSQGTAYGEQVSFTTLTPSNGMENGYEWVDLGLSVKWATFNVGANKPEEYGDYFAWGETEPKEVYDRSTYKWCNGSETTLTKYCTDDSLGIVDNKTQLELSDDAARVNWGGSWRMPTQAEQNELREQCTWTWTTQNGVNGYKVTSKSNGNSIFLPAAGHRYGSSFYSAGSDGDYWSSSLYTDYPHSAWHVYFYPGYVNREGTLRSSGFSVRPVCQ